MPTSASLHEIRDFLNSELQVQKFTDMAYNGLQIESEAQAVTSVACAVDCGLSVIKEAISRQVQLLVVHHGVYWGKVEPLTGVWAQKAAACLKHGLSVYAAHLPLDGHPSLGNAAQLASSILNACEIEPCFEYQGNYIGARANLLQPLELDEVVRNLSSCEGALHPPLVLPFGKTKVKTIGIATGSGSSMIPAAARLGLDLFISGEPKQEAYHIAKELNCSVIFMGHYASETFGVRALQRVLESRFGVNTEWISEPTGI